MTSKTGNEPRPPWIVSQSINPGDDPYWRTDKGRAWLRDIFLPFYDSLSEAEQIAYCDHWFAPTPWVTLFLHPELDDALAWADFELTGHMVLPLNFRKIFLDEAN